LLRAVASQSEGEPDLQVQVSAKVASFTVQEASAWLEWPEVDAFIGELAPLVRDCKGTASIGAMSPSDLHLSVCNVDSLGHFALKFTVGSMTYSQAGVFPCSLSGGFELELSQVEELLAWFKFAVKDNK
jgi:hypothetical protein